jgi:hypothetical protein
MDELETDIRNTLTVLKLAGDDGRVLPGAGASRSLLSVCDCISAVIKTKKG